MRTLLSQFCEEFDRAVRPLLDPIRRTTELLAQDQAHPCTQATLPGLLDVQHELQVLADKVAAQQAYVLIFGPLKSGKSTLMNAMSAAYVSEVTSLPAYPCMVYVSHADAREFVLTRYSGEQIVLHDPAALRLQIERAHADLAERMRRVEGQGHEFDPALHYPDAIRRIDVRVPAGELAQSGSVIVDTPGLYSRMRFGYDRMTREFRNAAACAIFVVKTDNLFLEQVFDEFKELLEHFSRIFLVVNLDSTKKDLRPDGSLVPSLESDDPIRVVQAFETLAMSAPLKEAADEGRLRIYPSDLLRAASRRLKGERAGEETHAVFGRGGEADFGNFLEDLTDYLNSTDYLVAFLGDSLRRAHSLLGETGELCSSRAVADLGAEIGRLENEQARCQAKLEALDRLTEFDWRTALAPLGERLGAVAAERTGEIAQGLASGQAEELARWFTTDASLHSLQHDGLRPLLSRAQNKLALGVHGVLAEQVSQGGAAISLPEDTAKDLVTVGLRVSEFGLTALAALDPASVVKVEVPPIALEEIPVQKTLWDWLLLRSQPRIRRRLFGAPDKPTLRIPREDKARRLGAPAKAAMQAALERYRERVFPELLAGIGARIFEDYSYGVIRALQARLEEVRAERQADLERLGEVLRGRRRLANRFAELEVALSAVQGEVDELEGRYQEADPGLLIQPLPPPPDAPERRVTDPREAPAERAAEGV